MSRQDPEIPAWTPGSGGVLLIAELANAHEGSVDTARRMIDAAADAGCGAVKFQKFYADEMLSAGHPNTDLFLRLSWPDDAWQGLVSHAHGQGLAVFVDVFGTRAYEFIRALDGVAGLKVHGADIGNEPLLEQLAGDDRPLLIGAGGSSDLDIARALDCLGRKENIVLMHGFQGFPTPLEDTALSRITHFQKTFGLPVGLSEHIDAEDPFALIAPLMAVPLGVCCVEKHLTLDRSKKGIDYQSSLEPSELKKLSETLRRAETAVGGGDGSKGAIEKAYRKRFKKSLVALRTIDAGETIASDDIGYKIAFEPPRHTLSRGDAIGKTAVRTLKACEVISHSALGAKTGLCLIARLKSTRLPNKTFIDIHGKSALERLFDRARLCAVDRIVVATSKLDSDRPLLDAAAEAGFESYAGDPEEPLQRMIACAEKWDWTHIARVTGDTVFLDPGLLDLAVRKAADDNLDYVSMWDAPIGAHCEIIRLSALKAIARHMRASFTSEYLSWFLFGNPNLRTAELDIPATVRRDWRLTLDTPEDLQDVRAAVKLLGPERSDYTLEELVRAVESDPELVKRVAAKPYRPVPPEELQYDFRTIKAEIVSI